MLPLMQITLLSAWLLLGASLSSVPVAPSAALFENDQVKVVRALEKHGVPGKFHQHLMNRVMIYLQPGRQRFTYQDGRAPRSFDWRAGQVVWSPPGGMHSPLTLDRDFNIVEVELKNKGSEQPITGERDPLKVDPAHYKLEFENAQVRVLRITMPPHATSPMHSFATNHVLVLLTAQKFRVQDITGKAELKEHQAGEVLWELPAQHAVKNESNEPFEALTVEIK